MRANNAIRASLPRGSYESLPVLVDKCFERRRRPTTNRFDQVVRSGEDPVLVVDGDLAQVSRRIQPKPREFSSRILISNATLF